MEISAQGSGYRELNAQVRRAIAEGETELTLSSVNGHRYLGTGLVDPVEIKIHGVAGNDLAAFMDGPHLTVYGNAQDGVGNTMNGGQVIIHGSVGDVMGYAMRGGTILVRGNVGYRAGIHMKSFKRQVPCIVVGGSAGDFLGEYMAGGTLVVLGLDQPGPPVGRWVATGMHGGAIYVRGELPVDRTGSEVTAAPAGSDDEPVLFPLLEEFAAAFDLSAAELKALSFTRLTPVSHRPYGNHYAG
jgi:glutamate synthase domain-containing protein 3